MRIFRGLENVHAIIDQHEAEWRKENGEEPLQPTPRIRARSLERKVVERYSEPSSSQEQEKTKLNPERFSQSTEPQVKAINVIEQGDGEHHSWLYKEVMKAINDAAAGNKNTKIVAVFVPVIQNSKEFDNLPADETVTISSAVNEEDVHSVKPESPEPEINTANIVEDLIPPTHIESDSELTEAFLTIEENLNSEPEPDRSALMMEAPDDSESGALPDEPAEPAAVESVEPVEPETVEIDLDEPEEQPETLAFDEITEEPVEDLELPDIPELETNPGEQTIELEAELPEEPVELVELVEGSDEHEESGELDEPVDSVEPQESEPEQEQEADSESEGNAEPEDANVAEVAEIAEVEGAKESPEVPDERFPLPDDPDSDEIIEDGDTLVLDSPEEGIGGNDNEPEGTQDNPEPASESKSESESDDDKLEDFGEIEII
ncbi:MAG: hypothetical protein IJT58_08935 [Synergistaceae bacterium]|nr:hypothetical protein [Synergistaceae bacterium]